MQTHLKPAAARHGAVSISHPVGHDTVDGAGPGVAGLLLHEVARAPLTAVRRVHEDGAHLDDANRLKLRKDRKFERR